MSGVMETPASWTLTNVGDICLDLQYGYTASASTEPCGPRFLRITDIQDGRVNWPCVPYCLIEPDQVDKYALREGDIVFARTGGTVGKSFIINTVPEPSVFASYLIRLTPHAEIVPSYLYYFFQSLSYWNQIGLKKGGLQGNVNATTLSSLEVPLCSANEQRRIVAKIEELFSELDKGVENLETARKQLQVYRQAVLKNAFEGKLTERWRLANSAPQWVTSSLGEHLSYLTSGSRGWAKFYSQNGDIFIRAQNLKHDRLELAEVTYVTLPMNSEGMRTRVQVGDVLITITGANVTKTGYVKSPVGTAFVSQHVALARPAPSILPEFLYWFLLAEAFGRKQLNALAYGAGKPGLNLENIRSVRVELPSLDEQLEVISKINTLLSIEETLSTQLQTELATCEALRQSILKNAFLGQLVAQDPRDEPASVLLDRIMGEKPEQVNSKRISRRMEAA